MPSRSPKRRVSRFRLCLRWTRWVLLVLILLLSVAFIYLHQAGLPEPLKRRLVGELRARGVALEFGRMRLRLYEGIVAEGVTLASSEAQAGPELTIPELTLHLDFLALLRFRLQVSGVEVQDGRLVLPVTMPNEPPQRLTVDRVAADIRFLPDDRWELARFTAESLGVRLHLTGQLANASLMRDWKPPVTAGAAAAAWPQRLHRFMTTMRSLQFSQPPELHLDLEGDARDPLACVLSVRFNAREADTRWGSLGRLSVSARLNEAADRSGHGRSTLRLEATDVRTPWSEVGLAKVDAVWTQSPTNLVPTDLDWELDLAGIYTPWGETPRLHFTAVGQQAPSNPAQIHSELRLTSGDILSGLVRAGTNRFTARLVHDMEGLLPKSGDWELEVSNPVFEWGAAQTLRAAGRLERAALDPGLQPDTSWGWWSWFAPLRLALTAEARHLSVSNLVADVVSLEGDWTAPRLELRRCRADLYDRQCEVTADLDVTDRRLRAAGVFDFDVHRLGALLPEKARLWLEHYDWEAETPPSVRARLQLTLPAWTNAAPDWRAEVAETLDLQGALTATNATYRGVPMDTVRFHFHHANQVWRLTDFVATAPEGRLEFAYTEDSRTKQYRFDLHSELDPVAVKPLVSPAHHRAFDLFAFSRPPMVTGVVQGRWKAGGVVGFEADVQITNFVFRGESIEDLAAHVVFTNGFLAARDVTLRSEGLVTAEGVGFDAGRQWLFLTNAQSSVAPFRIAKAIGPQVLKTLTPYVFLQPPQARVDGWLNVRDTREAGLRFELAGGPFHYWRFQIPNLRALVLWTNQAVLVRNLHTDSFYGGTLDLALDVNPGSPARGADFHFDSRVESVDFHALMRDLQSPTNRLEGRLTADWTVTAANSEDWHSWQGFGRAELRNGYLWDIPLFGVVSDFLDGIAPGLGRNRVTGLTATFAMTNSILHTADLQLRSPAMRLDYRGTFDFEGDVDARVEARLLRDTAVVGPVVSLLFSPLTKMLELKVTGTLGRPKVEPLYFPKPLLFPLNPFGTLRDMFAPEKEQPKPPP